jgi:hypothetical protein
MALAALAAVNSILPFGAFAAQLPFTGAAAYPGLLVNPFPVMVNMTPALLAEYVFPLIHIGCRPQIVKLLPAPGAVFNNILITQLRVKLLAAFRASSKRIFHTSLLPIKRNFDRIPL